jgi:hypothetical protein
MRLMRRPAVAAIPLVALISIAAPGAAAEPFTTGDVVQVSGASPIDPDCIGDTNAPPPSANVFNSEVEPWVAVDPAVDPPEPAHLIGAWQQDRWNTGGARGLVTATSDDGGLTWTSQVNTKSSICTGGTPANGGDYERASDPWVTISPDGTAYLMSLSVDTNPGGIGLHPNAMLVMRSTDGGETWENPITLKRDENPNVLNDKNTMTADPFNSDFVYAVWDRLAVPPGEAAGQLAFENTIAGKGPTWFARTTDGGDTWEPARVIFDPGARAQTIGNQIAATGSGDLVNAFDLIHETSNRQATRGFSIAVIRSEDHGASWDNQATRVDRHNSFQGIVRDPEDTSAAGRVRTGDILPEIATDLGSDAVYLVWQDARFGPRSSVAFSQSLDGGETWSDTIKINQTPDLPNDLNEQAFTPMVRVADDGTVTVTYYDFRNNTPDPATLPTDAFAIHCHAPSEDCSETASWGDDAQLTDESFDMRQAPFANGFFVGDYVGLDTDGTNQFPFWSMSHPGDPASVFVRVLSP